MVGDGAAAAAFTEIGAGARGGVKTAEAATEIGVGGAGAGAGAGAGDASGVGGAVTGVGVLLILCLFHEAGLAKLS